MSAAPEKNGFSTAWRRVVNSIIGERSKVFISSFILPGTPSANSKRHITFGYMPILVLTSKPSSARRSRVRGSDGMPS